MKSRAREPVSEAHGLEVNARGKSSPNDNGMMIAEGATTTLVDLSEAHRIV